MFRRRGVCPSALPKEIVFWERECNNTYMALKKHDFVLGMPRDIHTWLRDDSAGGRSPLLFLFGRSHDSNYYLATSHAQDVTGYYHVLVVQIQEATYIVPYRTSNGTYVNGARAAELQPMLLKHRDVVTCGGDGTLTRERIDCANPFMFMYLKLDHTRMASSSFWGAHGPHSALDTAHGDAMLNNYIAQDVPDINVDVLCPVCHERLHDPYTTSCGHTACHGCLIKWRNTLRAQRCTFTCPICRNVIGSRVLYPNIWLRNFLSDILPPPPPPPPPP